jgi:hypothetical protein
MAEATEGWEASLPHGWGDRLRAVAAPALLVAVATLGVHRSITLDQSTWQGASFGMFATYDNSVSRIVRVTIDDPSGAKRATLPPDLRDDDLRLRVVPTAPGARRLARSVLERVRDDGAERVTVEVWRLRLRDRAGHLQLRMERIVSGVATR